ncbi:VOC family protein [Nonomuraea sp. FMUSA5-5]|uniref:VOC family protein n=1 Tax=Nonomuraea composti TaxID=2720023 RepID=A0ABX1B6H8_9ACTN|nr:VOC family protein [Nonomuraea sp. FMUSA5-5]NJP91904.1 VOC family protein [Nonomuraea sp. FMUSA5-5]
MDILGIDNVLIPVGDLAAARRFYADGLGLKVKFEKEAQGVALFTVGAEAPGILVRVDTRAGRPGPGPAMRLWLEVPDARAVSAELDERGIRPLTAPFEVGTGWAVEVADPWGNVIGFTDYLERPELSRPRP